ncbi:MAG TPA: lactonase family protein [Bacteroidota bacterium]|nr:lactonase family protein [Bacteroidota bacterium]
MTRKITRREFLATAGTGLAGIIAADTLFAGVRLPGDPAIARLFVGTYTSGKSEGIYRCRFDTASGELHVESATGGVTNPSFIALDRNRSRLFCVNETAEFDGKPGGSVSAFAVDPETGDLHFLNSRSTHGAGPCYLTIDAAGRYVLAANYTGGSLAVLPVGNDGSLGEATDFVQHRGSSVTPRQQGPHAHSIVLDASGRFAYAADLGLDRVMIYRFDHRAGKLLPSTPPWAALKAGAGPRHIALSPDGSAAYVADELDSTLTVFSVDRSTGGLEHRQTLSTLPSGFAGENLPADVHVDRSGRFVYVSNRGHDSIAVFAVDATKGVLSPVQHAPTGGKWPRNFTIDPAGGYLLVANQRSDTITVFAVHPESGTLSPKGQATEIPSPVCMKFG